MLSTEPVKISIFKNNIKSVICSSPEGEIEFICNKVIESVPLKSFISLLKPQPPSKVISAQQKLTYRSQVYLFITLNKESVTKDQWIYFPNTEIPIGRMSEMKNFSLSMCPEGTTSLFIEFFCTKGDNIWNMNKEALYEYTLKYLVSMNFIIAEEVRNYYHIRQADVYPIYDTNYKEYLNEIKKYLDKINNLYYIGRPGRFRYNNQDHSLEMGILAAKSIIDGTRYDIESVGTEESYFESGTLKRTEK